MALYYPSSAEVREYGTGDLVPAGVVGSDPLQPPDETYIEYRANLTGTSSGVQEFGVAYFDPVDLTSAPEVYIQGRFSGYVEGGATYVGAGLAFWSSAAELGGDWGSALDSTNSDGAFDVTWGDPAIFATDYVEGTIVLRTHALTDATREALRDGGLVVECASFGSGPGAPTTWISMRVHELSILVPVPLSPCYETLTATTWDQWADGDDGTSVTLGVAGATYSHLTQYDGRSVLDITANFRASSTETTDSTIDSIEVGDAWDGSAFRNLASSGSVSIPNDGVVRDYSVTLTFTEDAATIRDALDIAGNAALMFNTSSARDVFIHEASLRVGHKCVVPLNPLRQWPGGATSIRQHPRRGTRRPGTY